MEKKDGRREDTDLQLNTALEYKDVQNAFV
jgi:hypothetical protein